MVATSVSKPVAKAIGAPMRLVLAFVIATPAAWAQDTVPTVGSAQNHPSIVSVQDDAKAPSNSSALAPASARARPVPPSQQPASGSLEAAKPAIDLSVIYTAEVLSNLRGGLRRTTGYLDNLDVLLTIDAERAFGWQGATIFAYGLYNNGVRLSESVVGDTQVVSNIETGIKAVRLYEAWVEQRFAKGRASVKVGLYDLNTEFDVVDTGALFLLSSHGIGPDFSQTGQNGPSIFPVTSLALRVDYKLTDNWLIRAALLDGVPGDPARAKRTTVKFGRGDGVLAIGEVAYVSGKTRAAAGYWRYSARFEDDLETVLGGQPVTRRGNDGGYLLLEHQLIPEAHNLEQGLACWLRFGIADAGFNPIAWYAGSGLVYTGPVAGRDDDQIGVAIAWAEFGERYRRARQLDGSGSNAREINIELSYRAPVTPWLTLQPDAQYIVNPGGVRDVRDALVIGLRAEIGF